MGKLKIWVLFICILSIYCENLFGQDSIKTTIFRHGKIGISAGIGYQLAFPLSKEALDFEKMWGLERYYANTGTVNIQLEYFINQNYSIFGEIATSGYSAKSTKDVWDFGPAGSDLNKGLLQLRFVPTYTLNGRYWFDTSKLMWFLYAGMGISGGDFTWNGWPLNNDEISTFVIQIGGGFKDKFVGIFGYGIEARYRYFIGTKDLEEEITAGINRHDAASDLNMGNLSIELSLFLN
jgi:hypothetical protein